jgi:hypothetical protein
VAAAAVACSVTLQTLLHHSEGVAPVRLLSEAVSAAVAAGLDVHPYFIVPVKELKRAIIGCPHCDPLIMHYLYLVSC